MNKKKILLLLSERVGDVIFCTPAIALLAALKPHAEIDALTPSCAAQQVLQNNPAIHTILVNPSKSEIKRLAMHYTTVIDLHNNRTTKKWCELLSPIVIYRNPRKAIPTTLSLPLHQSQVATYFMANMLGVSPQEAGQDYLLYPQVNDKKYSATLLQEHNIDTRVHKIIGCHMGSHTTTRRGWKFWKPLTGEKCWPVESFAQVMHALTAKDSTIRFVLTGTPSEALLAKKLKQHYPGAVDLVGKTSVLELAALMSSFRVFLTGDTGPMHIACASNTPTVGLFGPTKPAHTGQYPMMTHHIVLKAASLPEIDVVQVVHALEKVLGQEQPTHCQDN